MKESTAVIKNGEKQFVALCPELDVVSQGCTIGSEDIIITSFGIEEDEITANVGT